MSKYLKLVPCGQYRMTEQEIMEYEKMGILLGSHSYNSSFSYIKEIREGIKQEFPHITDDEIDVCKIHETNGNRSGFTSDKFAYHTMLWCSIPTEDYLRLKRSGEIGCL